MEERLERADHWSRALGVSGFDPAPIYGPLYRRTDAAGNVLQLSDSCFAFSGRRHTFDLSEAWLADVHVDDGAFTEGVRVLMRAAPRPYTLEFRLRRNDGRYRWIAEQSLPTVAADGRFLGYEHHALDIDPQARIAESLATRCHALRQAMAHHREIESSLAEELDTDGVQRSRAVLRTIARFGAGAGAGSLELVRCAPADLLQAVAHCLGVRLPATEVAHPQLDIETRGLEVNVDAPLLAQAIADILSSGAALDGSLSLADRFSRRGTVLSVELPVSGRASAQSLLAYMAFLHHGQLRPSAASVSLELPLHERNPSRV